MAIRETFPSVEVYGVNQMAGLGIISVLPFGAAGHRLPANPQAPLATKLENAMAVVTGVGVLGALGVATAAFVGGRGSGYGEEQYSYDAVTRITCDGDVPMDPQAPIKKADKLVSVGLKSAQTPEGEEV